MEPDQQWVGLSLAAACWLFDSRSLILFLPRFARSPASTPMLAGSPCMLMYLRTQAEANEGRPSTDACAFPESDVSEAVWRVGFYCLIKRVASTGSHFESMSFQDGTWALSSLSSFCFPTILARNSRPIPRAEDPGPRTQEAKIETMSSVLWTIAFAQSRHIQKPKENLRLWLFSPSVVSLPASALVNQPSHPPLLPLFPLPPCFHSSASGIILSMPIQPWAARACRRMAPLPVPLSTQSVQPATHDKRSLQGQEDDTRPLHVPVSFHVLPCPPY